MVRLSIILKISWTNSDLFLIELMFKCPKKQILVSPDFIIFKIGIGVFLWLSKFSLFSPKYLEINFW